MNLNSTQARIDAQLALEELSVQEGIAAYRRALEEEGTTGTTPGRQLIKAAMQPMIVALKEWIEKTGQGLASRNAAVYYFINEMEPEAVAWMTAHAALHMLQERPSLTRVATALALQLEASQNLDALMKANPKLGAKVAKQMEGIKQGRNRALFIRKGAAMVDVKIVQWDDSVRVRTGTLLLQLFADATELVTLETLQIGRGKTSVMVRPTESCRVWLEESHARCELLQPVRIPMVCLPQDWTNPFNGGYLTHRLRQPLVKTRNKVYLQSLKDHDMPWVYASVNALQRTEWAVNMAVYEVVKVLWEQNVEVAGLPPREPLAMPVKNWTEGDVPPPEVLHAWKVDAARTYEADAKAESKRLQLVQKLLVAEKMVERGNSFFYVYNLDWRGRMYPVGPALTPQGDDVAKGMLKFAQRFPLGNDGAYWLGIHTANSFGVDKVSFEERIEWVEENAGSIIACGTDPLAHRWWQDADSPFVFLAACMEYARLDAWVGSGNDQEEFQSDIAVAFDGSCNGLQNFSAMLRDPVGGAATGLVPGVKPADIYSEVAKAAQAIIDLDAAAGDSTSEGDHCQAAPPLADRAVVARRWVGRMTRKLAKRNTMTVPYGVTRRGMRDQLFGELKDSDPRDRSADADYLAACNHEAIGNVVVAARLAMDWLRDAAKVATQALTGRQVPKMQAVVDPVTGEKSRASRMVDEKGLPVRWTTPAGFLAIQDYRETVGQEIDFTVLGRRFRVMLNRDGDRLNSRKQTLGVSPNFVHSLDAAHLMRTVLFCAQDGMTDFAMIHDSYGVHAGNASRLRVNLRDAFVEQYSQPVLERFRDELLEQLPPEVHAAMPPLPPMGTLDLEQVKSSEYFFA